MNIPLAITLTCLLVVFGLTMVAAMTALYVEIFKLVKENPNDL